MKNCRRHRKSIYFERLNVEISELKAFMATVDTGSVTQAARFLYRTQSSISLRLKQLESKVGVSLLERRNDGVFPTLQGRLLYDYAQKILSLIDELEGKLHTDNTYREIKLGSISSLSAEHLHAILDRASDRKIDIDITLGNSLELAERLQSRDLDIVITGAGIVAENNYHVHLFSDDMVIISSRDRKDITHISELKDSVFLVNSKRSASSRNLNILFSTAGFKPKKIIECGSYSVLFTGVAKDKGISMVPKTLATSPMYRDSVKIHNISGEFTPFNTVLSYAKDSQHHFVLSLVSIIKDYFREIKYSNKIK